MPRHRYVNSTLPLFVCTVFSAWFNTVHCSAMNLSTVHCSAMNFSTGLWNWWWELCWKAGSAGVCGKCNINFLIFQSGRTAPSAAISITATGLRTSPPSIFYLISQKVKVKVKKWRWKKLFQSQPLCPALCTSWPSSSLYLISLW